MTEDYTADISGYTVSDGMADEEIYVSDESTDKTDTSDADTESETTVLTEGTDYTLSWSGDCTDAGTYTVTVAGKNLYAGTVEKTFTVKQKSISKFTGTITKYFKIKPKKAYTPTLKSSSKKKLKVSWKKSPGKVSGYQIYYRVKGTSTWKKVYTSSTSKTLKNLKSGKTYQVKIRAYKTIDGKKYFGSFSSVKTKKVK